MAPSRKRRAPHPNTIFEESSSDGSDSKSASVMSSSMRDSAFMEDGQAGATREAEEKQAYASFLRARGALPYHDSYVFRGDGGAPQVSLPALHADPSEEISFVPHDAEDHECTPREEYRSGAGGTTSINIFNSRAISRPFEWVATTSSRPTSAQESGGVLGWLDRRNKKTAASTSPVDDAHTATVAISNDGVAAPSLSAEAQAEAATEEAPLPSPAPRRSSAASHITAAEDVRPNTNIAADVDEMEATQRAARLCAPGGIPPLRSHLYFEEHNGVYADAVRHTMEEMHERQAMAVREAVEQRESRMARRLERRFNESRLHGYQDAGGRRRRWGNTEDAGEYGEVVKTTIMYIRRLSTFMTTFASGASVFVLLALLVPSHDWGTLFVEGSVTGAAGMSESSSSSSSNAAHHTNVELVNGYQLAVIAYITREYGNTLFMVLCLLQLLSSLAPLSWGIAKVGWQHERRAQWRAIYDERRQQQRQSGGGGVGGGGAVGGEVDETASQNSGAGGGGGGANRRAMRYDPGRGAGSAAALMGVRRMAFLQAFRDHLQHAPPTDAITAPPPQLPQTSNVGGELGSNTLPTTTTTRSPYDGYAAFPPDLLWKFNQAAFEQQLRAPPTQSSEVSGAGSPTWSHGWHRTIPATPTHARRLSYSVTTSMAEGHSRYAGSSTGAPPAGRPSLLGASISRGIASELSNSILGKGSDLPIASTASESNSPRRGGEHVLDGADIVAGGISTGNVVSRLLYRMSRWLSAHAFGEAYADYGAVVFQGRVWCFAACLILTIAEFLVTANLKSVELLLLAASPSTCSTLVHVSCPGDGVRVALYFCYALRAVLFTLVWLMDLIT